MSLHPKMSMARIFARDNSSSDSSNGYSNWGNATCVPKTDPNAVWLYCPSLAAAVLFAALFFLLTSAHIVLAAMRRTGFLWVLIMGVLWETAGFSVRAASTQFQESLALFQPSFLLVLLAPLWINAYVYMLFARVVYGFSTKQKLMGISATKLGVIFVVLDVIAFITQAAGGSMFSNPGTDKHTLDVGKAIYMTGIGLQESFILVFVCLVVYFQRNCVDIGYSKHLPRTFIAIYVSMALITLRICFRLAEYANGFDTALSSSETAQYTLDAVPMFFVALIWTIQHPGLLLNGAAKWPSYKQRKQLRKEQKTARDVMKVKGGQRLMSESSLERFDHPEVPAYYNRALEMNKRASRAGLPQHYVGAA